MSKKSAALAAALALAAGLAACATPTPYQPNVAGQSAAGGYSEIRVEPARYRVTFAGNTLTSRQTVEGYLLFRAAELTVQEGYDWFAMVDRNTDKDTRIYVDPWWGGYGYGGWHPYWRHAGFHGWGPYWGDPFWGGSYDVHTSQKFEASAEIVMGRGAKPANDPRAFDARAVIENLRPHVQYPQPK